MELHNDLRIYQFNLFKYLSILCDSCGAGRSQRASCTPAAVMEAGRRGWAWWCTRGEGATRSCRRGWWSHCWPRGDGGRPGMSGKVWRSWERREESRLEREQKIYQAPVRNIEVELNWKTENTSLMLLFIQTFLGSRWILWGSESALLSILWEQAATTVEICSINWSVYFLLFAVLFTKNRK